MVLWYNNKHVNVQARRGQAALEYVLAFAALLIAVCALYAFVQAIWRYADRTENLVTSDCP